MSDPFLAVFVGGRSSRMGGRPKGRLPAPGTGEPLVERLCRLGRAAGLEPFLVGEAAAYADLCAGVPRVADDPVGVGPLGGLRAALLRAGEAPVVTVACDMPHVTAEVLRRVADHPSTAAALAPRRGDGPFEPMLARFRPDACLPAVDAALARGVRSFQRLLAELDAATLHADDALARALEDWDTPEDVG